VKFLIIFGVTLGLFLLLGNYLDAHGDELALSGTAEEMDSWSLGMVYRSPDLKVSWWRKATSEAAIDYGFDLNIKRSVDWIEANIDISKKYQKQINSQKVGLLGVWKNVGLGFACNTINWEDARLLLTAKYSLTRKLPQGLGVVSVDASWADNFSDRQEIVMVPHIRLLEWRNLAFGFSGQWQHLKTGRVIREFKKVSAEVLYRIGD